MWRASAPRNALALGMLERCVECGNQDDTWIASNQHCRHHCPSRHGPRPCVQSSSFCERRAYKKRQIAASKLCAITPSGSSLHMQEAVSSPTLQRRFPCKRRAHFLRLTARQPRDPLKRRRWRNVQCSLLTSVQRSQLMAVLRPPSACCFRPPSDRRGEHGRCHAREITCTHCHHW